MRAVWSPSLATWWPGGWHAPRPRETFAGRPGFDCLEQQVMDFHAPLDSVEPQCLLPRRVQVKDRRVGGLLERAAPPPLPRPAVFGCSWLLGRRRLRGCGRLDGQRGSVRQWRGSALAHAVASFVVLPRSRLATLPTGVTAAMSYGIVAPATMPSRWSHPQTSASSARARPSGSRSCGVSPSAYAYGYETDAEMAVGQTNAPIATRASRARATARTRLSGGACHKMTPVRRCWALATRIDSCTLSRSSGLGRVTTTAAAETSRAAFTAGVAVGGVSIRTKSTCWRRKSSTWVAMPPAAGVTTSGTRTPAADRRWPQR